MTTRFQTRAFLICFIPFALLLGGSFWMIQRFVQSTVREGLRASLRENQAAIANLHAKGDLQNSRFLKVAGENAALKAGIELLRSNPNSPAARRTLEDQLRELGEHMGFDFLLVSAPNGAPLTGVIRPSVAGELVPLDITVLQNASSGLLMLDGQTFQVASVTIDQDNGNLGSLSVGEYFSLTQLATPAVLLHHGTVIATNIPNIAPNNLTAALATCSAQSECDLRLQKAAWISAPLQSWSNGYVLRSLENVDAATAPIQNRLHNLFLSLALICVCIVLLSSIVSARSIVEPIAAVVTHLRKAARTGVLAEFEGRPSPILEIRELAEIYNHAAVSVRNAGENLQTAYLEFVGSLASALDARDGYTSGHSWRVSHLSCAIASAMELPAADIERIRIGALLHDIGKIGIADRVLQKPGRLTEEEWRLIQQHPVIGRRILEGVHGFAPYLPAVELHHENWDGTGYPRGQMATETPIDARIIHVVDAYDAMTTDRSYRRAMTHERAISILTENAGRQFDARVVAIFLSLPAELFSRSSRASELRFEVEEPAMAVLD
ncbi:MAG TPA: HD-GYP domain-containing protein [Acidobacteriaceae bacterium]|nr:HD-GYP domain-containing protein [Acidobacteriaceae bacterium]